MSKAKTAAPTGSEKPKTAARPMRHEFKTRGHRWRVQSDDRGRFDECVVVTGKDTTTVAAQNGLVVHVEAMNDHAYYVDVAGLFLWVYIGRDGVARITDAEDSRGCAVRHAMPELRDPALDRKGYR